MVTAGLGVSPSRPMNDSALLLSTTTSQPLMIRSWASTLGPNLKSTPSPVLVKFSR